MNSLNLKPSLSFYLATAVILLSSLPNELAAQRNVNDPHLAYAYPAGCRVGTSCEVLIGGQYLQNVNSVHIAGAGVEVEILGWYRPMSAGVYNNLRMKLNDTREKLVEAGKKPTASQVAMEAGVTAEQLREMEIYRERDRDPRRQPNQQLEEELRLRLSAAADAEPGKREFRLLTDTAMSNPIWIHIGTLPEQIEQEPADDELADNEPERLTGTLPMLINGQIMPGDVDRFTFRAEQGTRLVIDAGARDVTPYLADAVPGWFQAVLTLTDSSGKLLSRADSFQFRQDPAILFEVPRDDWYTISIRDSLFRGREDFVYRMTIGQTPFITSIFPLGARLGSDVTVALEGWNLPLESVDVRAGSRGGTQSVHWVSLLSGQNRRVPGPPLRFPLQVNRLTESFEQEPNDDRSSAQRIDKHQIVNGRIERPGDVDLFLIESAGRLVIDVEARRHGSPLDSMVTLLDLDGNEVAYNDDYVDQSMSLLTHHADSHLKTTVLATEPRYLMLTDAQGKGGKDFVYRLHLRSPDPDFELRVVPSTIIAAAGATVPITVHALRKDGFEGEIRLGLTDPPPGFQLDGGLIGEDADQMRMTLKLPTTLDKGPISLAMEGQARNPRSSQPLIRAAVPAENMMQAFIWYHLVPVDEWQILSNGRRGVEPPFEIARFEKSIKLPLGGNLIVPAQSLKPDLDTTQLHVELVDPPEGVSAEIVTDEMGRFAVRISADQDDATPGWQGNLLLRAYRETTPAPTEIVTAPEPVRTDYGLLPAIPVKISERPIRRTLMPM